MTRPVILLLLRLLLIIKILLFQELVVNLIWGGTELNVLLPHL